MVREVYAIDIYSGNKKTEKNRMTKNLVSRPLRATGQEIG
jgi:hypothetical protein